MVRKWVALGLLIVAVAGAVLTVVGFSTTRYTVTTKHYTVDYDLTGGTYYKTGTDTVLEGPDQLVNWSSATLNQDQKNARSEWKEVPKMAEDLHDTPIWIGFVVFGVFGIAGLSVWKSIKYY